jgi:hypothetical protein
VSVALSDLIQRLKTDVPQQNSVPTDLQYQAAVEMAVTDFSEKAGQVKRVEISFVSGTASYAMPDDFVQLIEVEGIFGGGVLIPPGGKIIPLNGVDASETFSASGKTLTISPTPTYSADRGVKYKAGHYLDAGENYPDLSEHQALIIAPKAAAVLLRQMAASMSSSAIRFTFGDLTVDKSNSTKALSEVADQLEAEYAKMVKNHMGPIGLRATFSSSEIASYLGDMP